MVWFPASLLKSRRRLSTCATAARRRFVTSVEMSHGLSTLNSKYFVVYGQKHNVWVLVFLVGTSGTF